MDQTDQGWRPKPTGDAPAAPPETKTPNGVGRSFIGDGALFEGTLRIGPEGLHLDAEFRGTIITEGTVVVAQSGAVEADIHAREVVIGGAVVGNIVASRQLVLRAGARLHGDVETPCFELEKHAFFNGRSQMERPEAGTRGRHTRERPTSDPAATTPTTPAP